MTTDAPRQRERFSGDAWSPAEHVAGSVTAYTLRDEFDLAVAAKLAELLPAEPVLLRLGTHLRATGGRFAPASAVYAVVRPIELLGPGDLMPVHPSVDAVLATWGEEA
jgi:hypothetical protein